MSHALSRFFQLEACACLEVRWTAPKNLLDHLHQHRLVVADCSRLTPGNEAVGTDEHRTILPNPVRFTPAGINILKLTLRADGVGRQRYSMCRGDHAGCFTPLGPCTAC
jgi:hypothetical protein